MSRTLAALLAVGVLALTAGCGDKEASTNDGSSSGGTPTASSEATPSSSDSDKPEASGKTWSVPNECPDLAAFGDINGHTPPDNGVADQPDLAAKYRLSLVCQYPLGDQNAVVRVFTVPPVEAEAASTSMLDDLGLSSQVTSNKRIDMPDLGNGAARHEAELSVGKPTCEYYVPTSGGTLFVDATGETMQAACAKALEVLHGIG